VHVEPATPHHLERVRDYESPRTNGSNSLTTAR
jgi:hypothetical protein